MLDALRKPFFVAALVLLTLAVLVEIGSLALTDRLQIGDGELGDMLAAVPLPEGSPVKTEGSPVKTEDLRQLRADNPPPPGQGVAALALIDGLVLFTVLLMAAALVVPERVQARAQGLVTFVVTLTILVSGLVLFLRLIVELAVMLGLLLSIPFGTLIYLVIYGSFDRGAAAVALGLVMSLKLGFSVCLILAHQRYLELKGLVLIILTSLVATVAVSFLHGLVPGFLVSVTDAVAGIVASVLALVWAVVMLAFSIPSIVKAARA